MKYQTFNTFNIFLKKQKHDLTTFVLYLAQTFVTYVHTSEEEKYEHATILVCITVHRMYHHLSQTLRR